jgi:hypothetical protein
VRQAGNAGTRRAGDLPVAKFLNAGEREGPSVQTKYAAVTHFERWAAGQETRKPHTHATNLRLVAISPVIYPSVRVANCFRYRLPIPPIRTILSPVGYWLSLGVRAPIPVSCSDKKNVRYGFLLQDAWLANADR